MFIRLSTANEIIHSAFAKASEMELKPIAVCVYDSGGNLRAFQSQDGASNGRFAIAGGKARGALAVGTGSRWLNAQAQARPHFLDGLNSSVDGGIVPVPGGVLVRNEEGMIVGCVGISGDTSDNDEVCAVHGISQVGLSADTGAEAS